MPPLFANYLEVFGAILLVIAIVIAFLLPLIALIIAFFNRPRAKKLAYAALSLWGGGSILLLTRFDFSLFTEVPWVSAIAALEIGLATIAIFLPHPLSEASLVTSTRIRNYAIIIAITLIVNTIIIFSYRLAADQRLGEQKMLALLGGSQSTRIESIEITYQQRKVIITDPEVLQYLEERFHKPETENLPAGMTYRVHLKFEGGGSESFDTYWKGNDFSIHLASDSDFPPRYGVRLVHPMPTALEGIIVFLDKPYQDVRGTVVIAGPDGIRQERDEALIMP